MNLTEIKEMLGKITRFPWDWDITESHAFSKPIFNLFEKGNHNYSFGATKCKEDAVFITQAPTIISDLVKKVEGIKQNIYLHRLIGEMKGTIEMLLLLYGQQMEPHQIEHIKNLITKYEDYFKHR